MQAALGARGDVAGRRVAVSVEAIAATGPVGVVRRHMEMRGSEKQAAIEQRTASRSWWHTGSGRWADRKLQPVEAMEICAEDGPGPLQPELHLHVSGALHWPLMQALQTGSVQSVLRPSAGHPST